MKNFTRFSFVTKIFLFSILVLSIQCKKSKKLSDELNPAFTEKIAAFTSGIISSESAIRIILTEDNAAAPEANMPAEKNLFKFKPSIKGHTVWIDKRTLEFRPEEKLKSGETYQARFNLGQIVKVSKDLSVFEFSFSVVEQTWTVSVEGYQSHNENDLVWNRIKGSVNTADNIDIESLKKCFSAKQASHPLKLKWEPGEHSRNFNFSIDSVERKEKEGSVDISWNGSPDFPKAKGDIKTIIPSLSDYKVLDVKVIQQPEQFIQIMFSDPIRKNQDFDGLIFMDNQTSLDFSVQGNVIKAFPAVRLNGEAKLTISEGLKNILGYELKQTYQSTVTFEVPKPAVRLTGKGIILPSSKGMVFPFEAVNLSAVDVKVIRIFENNIGHFLQVNRLDGSYELKRAGRLIHKEKVVLNYAPADLSKWNRFYFDLSKMIEPDQGSIYRIEISFKKQYSLYPCEHSDISAESEPEEESGDDEMDYELSYWDSYEEYYEEYYDYGYDYNWEERDDPCSNSYYTQSKYVARNILASDIGIIAKSGTDQTLFCAITSLVNSKPLQDVEVTVYDYQQQPIGSAITDNLGFVDIPVKGKPFLLIAKSGKQRGYLRLDDGSSLSLGAFDVSGKSIPKGLKAFLYGERGVWRPGDTLFLTCILEDKQKSLPPNHPLTFELYNPKGQLYAKKTKTAGLNGFYTWNLPTEQDALTGNYNLKLIVGGASFNKTIKIETIKPNRLKINLDFGTKKLYHSNQELKGDLHVNWLHGAVASNLKSVVTVKLTEAPTEFEKYTSFQFTDPSRQFESEEQTVYEGFTNESGLATVPSRVSVSGNAPGMLNANFTTRVFEKSGDFSTDHFSIPYSPYSAYVGLRTPEGDKRGMLLTDTTHWVDVVLVDEKGNPVSRNNIEAYVYKLHWRNWWESSGNELAEYIGNTYNSPVVSETFSVVNGKGRFSFRINHPEWGRFYVRVMDPLSGHSSGKIVYIDWPGWAGRPMRDNPEAASMLTFNADKKTYDVGETAEIIIPSSGNGNALVCIENGSKVLLKEWVPVTGKEIRHRFIVTADMTPNVYVHVTLIQPHENSENDMPMRLYGVIPVFVEDAATRLKPVIKIPDVLEPMQSYSVQVSEQQKKEMTYTIAIVEEGLLDLTRYQTPDPWSEFYAREALGVKTWDLYDMVIGAFGGKLSSILGIGGDDGGINNQSAEKANRFKPVVKFVGPFVLKPGKTNTHTFSMPNYVGSVRAMVVSGMDGAYGYAEKTVPVKKPLMVLATLPRVLGPGESVKLPVTVFAMDNQIKKVTIQVKTNGLLTNDGTASKIVEFEKTGEKVIDFDMTLGPKTGVGKVQVVAVCGKNSASFDMEFDIRNANTPVTTFTAATLESGITSTIDFTLPGIPGSNSAVLEVSTIPPLDAGRRLKYLINYPHGCLEQTTSMAFAQLFLPDIAEIDQKTRSAIDAHIKSGIAAIQKFQISGGAFSYWPGQSYYNSWSTSYAGHFLLEAEKKGYAVPSSLKSAWLKAQKGLAKQWTKVQRKDPYYQDDLEQAYRLYTLALAGEPELSAMNRLREQKDLGLQAKWRLAAAYSLSGQLNTAKELIIREPIDIQQYTGIYSSYGSSERDMAMLLETLILMNNKAQAAVLTRKIAAALSSQSWMSTQTTAYCLMAVAKFAGGLTTDKLNFSFKSAGSKTVTVSTVKPLAEIPLTVGNHTSGSITLTNSSKGVLFVRVIMEGIPAAGEEKEFESNLDVQIDYFDKDGKALNVSHLTQGTDFMAIVSVYNPGAYAYREMALTQVFPSGWEITNNRLFENELAEGKDVPTYQDIRDDRVYTYFDLARGERKTFIIQLNASYTGRYYLPGPYCEAMYDNTISGLIKGQWIEVVKAGE